MIIYSVDRQALKREKAIRARNRRFCDFALALAGFAALLGAMWFANG